MLNYKFMRMIRNKFFYIFIYLFNIPLVSYAAGLIPDCNPTGGVNDANTCGLCDVLKMIYGITDFLMKMGLILSVVFIIVGAIVIMTARGSESQFKKGKEILTISIYGATLLLASWLIVNTILQMLSGSGGLPWTDIQCTQ